MAKEVNESKKIMDRLMGRPKYSDIIEHMDVWLDTKDVIYIDSMFELPAIATSLLYHLPEDALVIEKITLIKYGYYKDSDGGLQPGNLIINPKKEDLPSKLFDVKFGIRAFYRMPKEYYL